MKKTKTGYMCGIGFADELEHTEVTVYPSKKAILGKHDFEECGIALVEIKFKRWIRKPQQVRGRR